ncbi:MAG: hypothetical protein ACI9H9_000541 [Pseudoalteromonas tetraodonis]|jgi:hypothetical protein|uniref:DUF3103 domain-containing protein n=2 Tax=Pseudoalteromonas TaxID=53246 RepID=A0AA37S2A5_9GAMM|nr:MULTISPECIES: DUF3103 family protein [Pseudoalteromonas]MDN3433977.1 DUF3103 family protein [Pseudoalteromonas sp. APC 3356]PHQ95122.1 MAG: DUF3103 domain-containing protein [Pseudoalteromonas sp.]GEN36902.1 hypothetical protein PTE01_00120 [Pseudoalteromonas tetraodonis GFC]GLQ02773.1 hypothetical protein GCM10007914_16540 [Pseudoalteromonas tetraodonis GFC]
MNMMNKITKCLVTLALLNCVSAPAFSAQYEIEKGENLAKLAQYKDVATIKRNFAKQIALNYSVLNADLKQTLSQYKLVLNADQLPSLGMHTQQNTRLANNALQQLKGLPQNTGSLLQVRLASDKMLSAWQQGERPLFAFAPAGDDTQWSEIEAFDQYGDIHYLSVDQMPTQPVFIVELDQQKVQDAGIAVMRGILSTNKFSKSTVSPRNQLSNEQPLQTSVLKKIRLEDDKEPWISGGAEIYAIVTGVDPTRDEPILDIVDLPYLDHDQTDYSPNQVLIHWQRYRWQAVDLLLMEQDDNTNYKTLAIKLLEISEQVMASIPDLQAQGYAIIPKLTNELLKAMPDEWFTNNDDYVDVFYTLFENKDYQEYKGASSNATITLSPLEINPRLN